MIDYKSILAEKIEEALGKIFDCKDACLERDKIEAMIEIPGDDKMGDYAFPCFSLAKVLRKAPAAIATDLGKVLFENAEGGYISSVSVVNAYVNIRIDRNMYAKELISDVLAAGDKYGRLNVGEGRRVIVEYSAPNIAKPFHIGHIRSTVIGNAIYKIYDALGYNVERINHLGDYGTQFGKMICSYRRWGNREDVIRNPIETLLKYYTKFHVEVKDHPELEDEAREIFKHLEEGRPEEVELWKWFRDESLKEFERVYNMLGIHFDSYAGESFYSDKMPAIIEELKEKDLLKDSEGAKIVDLEESNLPPALIMKSDGSTLYITRDIAAAFYRKKHYDFYKNIYVVASQQNLHFEQWIKIVEMMGYDWAKDCIHVPFGLVSLKDGTMSTREGRVVFLEDVLRKAVDKTREIIGEKKVSGEVADEIARQVGIGAVVFQELSNNRIKDYVFDWDRVLNFDGETGPYVQYTHVRATSVLKNVGDEDVMKAVSMGKEGGLKEAYLTEDYAFELIKLLYAMPQVILEAGEKYEPSILSRYLLNIAKSFNRFYHNEHVNVDNVDERMAKVALVVSARHCLKHGLELLGMAAPEEM